MRGVQVREMAAQLDVFNRLYAATSQPVTPEVFTSESDTAEGARGERRVEANSPWALPVPWDSAKAGIASAALIQSLRSSPPPAESIITQLSAEAHRAEIEAELTRQVLIDGSSIASTTARSEAVSAAPTEPLSEEVSGEEATETEEVTHQEVGELCDLLEAKNSQVEELQVQV